jgi:hypothetical protein
LEYQVCGFVGSQLKREIIWKAVRIALNGLVEIACRDVV